MIATTHAPKHRAPVSAPVSWIFDWNGQWLRTEEQHLDALQVHRVAATQHRHPPDRPTIDVQAAAVTAHLQPHAASIDAELDGSRCGISGHGRLTLLVQANRMHALAQHQVGDLALRESKSEGIHAAANLACPAGGDPLTR
ncbi:MAG TPA: hypothetical protein VK827_03100 [Lysobacter sp.]|nr:hypothetical protein [Lysobacter sp.]